MDRFESGYLFLQLLTSVIFDVYSLLVFFILIIRLFLKGNALAKANEILYACNTLLPWAAIVNLLSYFLMLFIAWYGQNPYEWYAFRTNSINTALRIIQILAYTRVLFMLLLFIKRLRKSAWYSLVVLLLMNAWWVISCIIRRNQDYLPSSWSTTTDYGMQKIILYNMAAFLFVLTWWIIKKKKKIL